MRYCEVSWPRLSVVGGRQRPRCMYVSAVANLHPPPPSMLHVACPCWRCSAWYVVEAAAQPGFFSRAKSARHESWRGCGPRVRPRWSLLGCGCASPAAIVRLCSSQATKMLACEPVCCVFVVSRCVRDACRCVTELACRLGSGRPQVCVKRAPAQRVSLPRVGSALRLLLNPSRHGIRMADAAFSKRTRPRVERAGGQPLGRLTSGFLHLKALEPPYNPPREAPLKIRLRWSRRL